MHSFTNEENRLIVHDFISFVYWYQEYRDIKTHLVFFSNGLDLWSVQWKRSPTASFKYWQNEMPFLLLIFPFFFLVLFRYYIFSMFFTNMLSAESQEGKKDKSCLNKDFFVTKTKFMSLSYHQMPEIRSDVYFSILRPLSLVLVWDVLTSNTVFDLQSYNPHV